ncbi:hypothetical protein KQX54_018654 [Cotesia glomerata]|uniref:Uncharacterized protein n=1 Tax=Cotesia glomerata TaxID=32391 RepID=A0AAV7I2H7_COTGL|nr:hypothetical protein KQX54_018654 [Cotesia glomerata]
MQFTVRKEDYLENYYVNMVIFTIELYHGRFLRGKSLFYNFRGLTGKILSVTPRKYLLMAPVVTSKAGLKKGTIVGDENHSSSSGEQWPARSTKIRFLRQSSCCSRFRKFTGRSHQFIVCL